jgi:hypothetical protein
MKRLFLLIVQKLFPSFYSTVKILEEEEIIIRSPDIDLSKATISIKKWEEKINKAVVGNFPAMQLSLLHFRILDLHKFADSPKLSLEARDANAKVISILIAKLAEAAKPYRGKSTHEIILN